MESVKPFAGVADEPVHRVHSVHERFFEDLQLDFSAFDVAFETVANRIRHPRIDSHCVCDVAVKQVLLEYMRDLSKGVLNRPCDAIYEMISALRVGFDTQYLVHAFCEFKADPIRPNPCQHFCFLLPRRVCQETQYLLGDELGIVAVEEPCECVT